MKLVVAKDDMIVTLAVVGICLSIFGYEMAIEKLRCGPLEEPYRQECVYQTRQEFTRLPTEQRNNWSPGITDPSNPLFPSLWIWPW